MLDLLKKKKRSFIGLNDQFILVSKVKGVRFTDNFSVLIKSEVIYFNPQSIHLHYLCH